MKKLFIHDPWPYAIIGSLLIISSAYILGVITFKAEQELLKIQKKIAVNEYKGQESKQYYDTANMQVRLAVIQNTVLKNNLSKNANLQKKARKLYVQSLFADLLRLSIAAGETVIDQKQVEKFNQYSTKASEGDDSALEEINCHILELLLKSDNYRKKLKVEQERLGKYEDELKQSIISWRNWAIIMQIFGLLLLLTKEFPDYLWGSKKQDDK